MKKIRRRHRTPYRRRRLFKKKKMLMRKKGFNKMLNNVAEKKVFQSAIDPVGIHSMLKSTSTVAADSFLLSQLAPVQGPAYNQSIGARIFLRYIRLQIAVSSGIANYHLGDIYLVLMRTRGPNSPPGVTLQLFFSNSGQPFLDPQYMKDEIQWIKYKKFTSMAANATFGHPNVQAHHVFKVRFRIMEYWQRNRTTGAFVPEKGFIYYMLCYPNTTLTNGAGASAIAQQVYTYTDV